MRRHPKAAGIAPTARTRSALGIVALLLAAAAFLGLAPTAFAAKTVVNTIGGEATGITGGAFNTPRGIAVNQTGNGGVPAGTFYVADSSNHRIEQFAPSGAFVRTWGWGVKDSESEFEICSVAANCKAGKTGSGAGQLSSPQGVAVNQATGAVFVSNQGTRRIDVFSATGIFQGGFGWGALDGSAALQFCTVATTCHAPAAAAPTTGNVGAGQFGTAMGNLALDAAGNVYLADKSSRRVDVFKPLLSGNVVTGVEALRSFGWGAATGAAEFEVCSTATCKAPAAAGTGLGQFGANSPSEVALDSTGNVFALDAANKRVQEFSSTPVPVTAAFGAAALTTAFGTGALQNLAIDPGTDHVFVSGARSAAAGKVAVLEMDGAGAAVETAGTDLTPTTANGLAVAKASLGGGIFLTSNSGGQRLYVLGEAPTIAAPTAITGSGAVLHGTVVSANLGSTYRFEYSTDGTTWTKLPAVDAIVPAQPGSVAVEQEATGLKPSTQYTARLVATRPASAIAATSATTTFSTAGAVPVVTGTLSAEVTNTSARLIGYLSPSNQSTTYRFEYGPTAAYGKSIPLPEAIAGSGLGQVTVSQVLAGLNPSTTYHFQIVATNATGSTPGPDDSFTTLAVAPLAPSRAYELVSPPDKGGNDVSYKAETGSFFTPLSSVNGESVAFTALGAFPGAVANGVLNTYQATRSASGWSTTPLSPPMAPTFSLLTSGYVGFSPDLSRSVFFSALKPALAPGAAEGTSNMYLRESSGAYRVLSPGAAPENPEALVEFGGAADDFSHAAIITYRDPLTPDSPAGVEPLLYDWSASSGEVSLVGRLPDGSVSPESVSIAIPPVSGSSVVSEWNAVSADGSRIFFYTPAGNNQQLYVRINGTSTQQVSKSQATVPDPEGTKPAFFWLASDDGSSVFFSDSQKLTDDATTGPGDVGQDLYRYRPGTEALTDITVDGTDTEGAQVLGVLGAAEDGSSLYFAAKGVLAPGAVEGEDNLYRWVDDGSPKGEISFIARGANVTNWTNDGTFHNKRSSRVTPDGKHLLFESTSSLTGYPNAGKFEAYLYDASSGDLRCASCNPAGTPATADAFAIGVGDGLKMAQTLTDDGGKVFFSTTESLVAADNDGVEDAYEYNAEDGQINLISAGSGDFPSSFSDAGSDGRDVFFTTRDRLVGIDVDENVDVYDARVGGGIAAQNPSSPPPPCSGAECRGPVAVPAAATPPASSALNGPGNQKPVHKKHKQKQKHQKKKRHAARHANRHGNR